MYIVEDVYIFKDGKKIGRKGVKRIFTNDDIHGVVVSDNCPVIRISNNEWAYVIDENLSLFRIEKKDSIFGLLVNESNVIVLTAPIGKRFVGKKIDEIIEFCNRNQWKIEKIWISPKN